MTVTEKLIMAFAISGAYESGKVNGRHDSTIGRKFRSAFVAADEAGLTTETDLIPLRNMFVQGYLGALPENGVRTDADGIVVGCR